MTVKTKLEVEDHIANEFGHYLEMMGAKATLGRIWGLLLTQSKPMSLKDIAFRLNVSKPAVSTTIKIGAQLELFKKVYNPEFPRESFYEVKVEFMEMIIDPGLKKLKILTDQVKRSISKIEEVDYKKDKDLLELHERMSFLYEAFEIINEEYIEFGNRFVTRLREAKKNRKKGDLK